MIAFTDSCRLIDKVGRYLIWQHALVESMRKIFNFDRRYVVFFKNL